MLSIFRSPSAQAVVALMGTWLLAFGLKSAREAGGFDTRNPSPQSWRFWAGLVLLSLSLVAAGLTPFAADKPASSPPAPSPQAPSSLPQAPAAPPKSTALAAVDAKDLWQFRSACARLGTKLLEGFKHRPGEVPEQVSHYSREDGRCYVEIDANGQVDLLKKGEYRYFLYDGQTKANIAWTVADVSGKGLNCYGWSEKSGLSTNCDQVWEFFAAAMQE